MLAFSAATPAEEDAVDLSIETGPFQRMECSADGKYLACWAVSGTVMVYTADFQEVAYSVIAPGATTFILLITSI